jgi:hypothetical protein
MGTPAGPESVTEQIRELWRSRGALIGERFEVPPCPYTTQELAALDAAGRRAAYLPPDLATQAGRHVLGRIFPLLQCFSVVEDNAVTNDQDHAGWFDYSTALESEHRGTNGDELLSRVLDEGRQLMTLNQYLVASHDNRAFTGRNFDDLRTWSRVASRMNGRTVAVRIDGPTQDEVAFGVEVAEEGSLLTGYDMEEYVSSPVCGGRGFGRPAATNDRPSRRHAIDWSHGSARLADLDLAAERDRQAELYVAIGVADELGMTAEDYRASLPRFAPQPPSYAGRLDVPLLVETRVPWRRLAALADMTVAPSARIVEPVPAEERFAVPAVAYAGWFTDWGQRFPDPIDPITARAQLTDDEVGTSAYEGIAMGLVHPQVFAQGRFWDTIGSLLLDSVLASPIDQYDVPVRTMGIYRWRRRPELAANMHQVAIDAFRPLVRGADIVT